MAGRKSKLTPELIKQAAEYTAQGHYAQTVCKGLGIAEGTYYRWLQEADDKGGLYHEFREAIQKAEAEAEQYAIEQIREHARENWTAWAWYLERRFPARWGRFSRHTVEHSGEVKHTVDMEQVRGELGNRLTRLAKLNGR